MNESAKALTVGVVCIALLVLADRMSVEPEKAPEAPPEAVENPALPMTTTWAMASLEAALETLPPLSAAGILAANGWDCLPYPERRACWSWTKPTTGAPVDHYVVEWRFAVTDTAFWYWLDLPCNTESVRVAGVDSMGRQGVWSETGVCQ